MASPGSTHARFNWRWQLTGHYRVASLGVDRRSCRHP